MKEKSPAEQISGVKWTDRLNGSIGNVFYSTMYFICLLLKVVMMNAQEWQVQLINSEKLHTTCNNSLIKLLHKKYCTLAVVWCALDLFTQMVRLRIILNYQWGQIKWFADLYHSLPSLTSFVSFKVYTGTDIILHKQTYMLICMFYVVIHPSILDSFMCLEFTMFQ